MVLVAIGLEAVGVEVPGVGFWFWGGRFEFLVRLSSAVLNFLSDYPRGLGGIASEPGMGTP
jgi:hypothetical protein